MKRLKKWTKAQTMLFIMAAMGAVFLLVFNYAPMFGIVLAFKKGDYVINIKNAIFHSEWVGWENFEKFLTDPEFKDVVINTLGLNVLSLVVTFPAPIIFGTRQFRKKRVFLGADDRDRAAERHRLGLRYLRGGDRGD